MHSKDAVRDSKMSNLTLVQCLAALLVVFSHSYPLGERLTDPLTRYSHKGVSFGALAVAVFMIFSGYNVAQSFVECPWRARLRALYEFSVKRILRIWPTIFFTVALSVLVIGPMMTTLELSEYFSSDGWLRYCETLSLFTYRRSLPGCFATNVFKDSVNGSLWIIPWQMWCYVLLALVGVLGFHKSGRFVICLWLVAWCLCIDKAELLHNVHWVGGASLEQGIRIIGFFLSGWVWRLFEDRIKLDGRVALACGASLLILIRTPVCDLALATIGCYLLMYLVFAHPLGFFARLPPVSFGIFVMSFPVQQCLVACHGGRMNHLANFFWASAIVIPVAFVEYFTIERSARAARSFLLRIGRHERVEDKGERK